MKFAKLVVVWIVLTLILGECATRIFDGVAALRVALEKRKYSPLAYSEKFWRRSNRMEGLMKFNPVWFYDFVPGAHTADVRINSAGFRGDEIAKTKPSGGRIVCIGSSSTFGHALKQEATYPKKLQAFLNQRLKEPVEVVNAGFPNFKVWQYDAFLESKILPLKPDRIVLYCAINDLYLISPDDVIKNSNRMGRSGPTFLLYVLANKSHLYNAFLRLSGIGFYSSMSKVPPESAKQYVPSRFINDYANLVDHIRRNKIRLTVCTFPSTLGERINAGATDLSALEILYAKFNAAIENIAAQKNVELVRLADIKELNRKDMFMDECHPTDGGTDLIVKAIGDHIVTMKTSYAFVAAAR